MDDQFRFPDDFVWGTATASYQIEGAADEDGRGRSIWDTFSHTPGRVINGDTGDVAADHYHRWRDDVALLTTLNLDAYRLSLAWPRIFPEGRGRLNEPGVDFYDRLIDRLLEAGITPYVTLYHWDLPQTLEDEGGWLRRGIADDYVGYVDAVSRTLGDRVKHWITFNEAWVFTWLGYVFGIHAPGYATGDPAQGLRAAHHVLLAHGMAVPVLRANSPGAQVGITNNLTHVMPLTDSAEDAAVVKQQDGFLNRWFMDPIFKGYYPQDLTAESPELMPDIQPGDLDIIRAPLDFLGLNYYQRTLVSSAPDQLQGAPIIPEDAEKTAMGWEVYPDGLYQVLKRIQADYDLPAIYITENGAAYEDVVTPDGRVHDAQRVEYLRRHFAAAAQARDEGVRLKGYFVWSLLDNFEWAEGYAKRFGVVHVNYETQERIIKDSGHYLAGLAAE